MRCLCCGKEITDRASVREMENRWHDKCVKQFFGTRSMLILDVREFAENCGISVKAAEKIERKVCSLKAKFEKECDESQLPQNRKQGMKDLIAQRMEIFA